MSATKPSEFTPFNKSRHKGSFTVHYVLCEVKRFGDSYKRHVVKRRNSAVETSNFYFYTEHSNVVELRIFKYSIIETNLNYVISIFGIRAVLFLCSIHHTLQIDSRRHHLRCFHVQ